MTGTEDRIAEQTRARREGVTLTLCRYLSGEAGLAIQRLGEGVTESAQAALQIAAAAGQQVTTQSLSSTQQSERSAEEMNDLAGRLDSVVTQYQL